MSASDLTASLELAEALLDAPELEARRVRPVLDLLAASERIAGDAKMLDLKNRICIEGQQWRCVLDGFVQRADADTAVLADSAFLKGALGAAQQVADTQQLLAFSRAAVRHFPRSVAFWKALGQAFELKGAPDSVLAAYRKLLALDPSDMKASLLVAKAIVDQAVYDTATANRLKGDSVRLRAFRMAFADRLDTAHAYLSRAIASPDSGQQLTAAVILLILAVIGVIVPIMPQILSSLVQRAFCSGDPSKSISNVIPFPHWSSRTQAGTQAQQARRRRLIYRHGS